MDHRVERFKTRLTSLNGQKERNPERLKQIAQEFESVFLGHLLKVMNESVEKSELFGDGLGGQHYTEVIEQEMARQLSRHRGLGLSEAIYEHLVRRNGDKPAEAAKPERSGFLTPTRGTVSSDFGFRRDPLTGDVRFHKGTDLAAPAGMPIVAARHGTVVFSGQQGGFGNTIVIEHAGGYRTRYAHLQSNRVSAGDYVQAGQLIGHVGRTGRATGSHLHFEVLKEGAPVDPKLFLDRVLGS